jgi:transposase
MERSTIHLLTKRGKSQRAIAQELQINRRTVARALKEPVEKIPAQRQRGSSVDPFRDQIKEWLREDLSIVRMLELARADPDHPFAGGRSTFSDGVQRIRRTLKETDADVPIRFEGLPGEYLQVDWGEIRHFPFTQAPPGTRYFLACRLKYSRWSWVRWTTDMRQETLIRGLVACMGALGWVPWVLVFDNMKTVTSGRDGTHQPIWTPALLHLAAAFDFHPEACAIGAANQKGSVESLVKWVKGNFLAGRSFADDADLARQTTTWLEGANARPSAATNEPPNLRLVHEAVKGGRLPPEAADYALRESAQVSDESMVLHAGNAYSVPLGHVGAPVTVRIHVQRVRIFRDTLLLADHLRVPEGAHRRIVEPQHFADVFSQKARAQVMLYRAALLDLGESVAAYIAEVSQRRRETLGEEILALYALLTTSGVADFQRAIAQARERAVYGAEYVRALLTSETPTASTAVPLTLVVPGVPSQTEVDRILSSYEAFVVGAVAVGGEG